MSAPTSDLAQKLLADAVAQIDRVCDSIVGRPRRPFTRPDPADITYIGCATDFLNAWGAKVIIVEGLICSGRSTLIRDCAKSTGVALAELEFAPCDKAIHPLTAALCAISLQGVISMRYAEAVHYIDQLWNAAWRDPVYPRPMPLAGVSFVIRVGDLSTLVFGSNAIGVELYTRIVDLPAIAQLCARSRGYTMSADVALLLQAAGRADTPRKIVNDTLTCVRYAGGNDVITSDIVLACISQRSVEVIVEDTTPPGMYA
jgi:hypothetical protein